MNHYHWTEKLRKLYDKTLAAYRHGGREADAMFSAAEMDELGSVGLAPINVFDYVEDFEKSGEPHWDDFLLVASARRDYYIYKMRRDKAGPPLRVEELPAKTEAIAGIEWLPRIVVKAHCFLEGRLPREIMYGCGGDRRFLKERDIHLADFLRITWAAKGDANEVLRIIKA